MSSIREYTRILDQNHRLTEQEIENFEKRNWSEDLLQKKKELQAYDQERKKAQETQASFDSIHTALSLVSSSANIALGVAAISTGIPAYVLIGAGAANLANEAMKHLGGWDFIYSCFTQDPSLQEKFSYWTHKSIQALSVVSAGVVSGISLAGGVVTTLQKVTQVASHIGVGVTSIAHSKAQYDASLAKRELTNIQMSYQHLNFYREKSENQIKAMQDHTSSLFQALSAMCRKLIEMQLPLHLASPA